MRYISPPTHPKKGELGREEQSKRVVQGHFALV
jgi:hypothetical protein